MTIDRRWLVALACLVGCGPDEVAISDEATDLDTGMDTTSESESESEGIEPDMAAQPICPGGLGEVVSCECAVVEDCGISDEPPSNACVLECEGVSSPCSVVSCSFDGSTNWPTCESDVEADALQCVFDALAEGQPMQWTIHRLDTGFNGAGLQSNKSFLRLDETTYVVDTFTNANRAHSDFEDWWSVTGFEAPEAAWMECDAMATDYERFNCLHDLSGEPCADPSALICP